MMRSGPGWTFRTIPAEDAPFAVLSVDEHRIIDHEQAAKDRRARARELREFKKLRDERIKARDVERRRIEAERRRHQVSIDKALKRAWTHEDVYAETEAMRGRWL